MLTTGCGFGTPLLQLPEGDRSSRAADETRTRRLLLHASEIERLTKETRERGASLVPLKLYFKKGWAKMLLGVAHGRSKIDKRAVIKKREADRDLRRALTRD